MEFSAEQLKIIENQVPHCLVEAHPGSGKTGVLVERLIRVVKKKIIQPSEMVAITFTERAAAEMKARVRKELQVELWIDTIHGFCRRILGDYLWEIGYPKGFSMLSAEEARFLQNKILTTHFQSYLRDQEPRLTLLVSMYGQAPVMAMIEILFEHSFLIQQCRSEFKTDSVFREQIQCLLDVYDVLRSAFQNFKREQQICDFNDLLNLCYELLSSKPEILKNIHRRFKLIFIDEFQDTDGIQIKIIELLKASTSLMLVGDPKQSIYRFRGADVHLFGQVKQDLLNKGGAVYSMVTNFRSQPFIIEFVNRLFSSLLPHFVPSQPFKKEGKRVKYWTLSQTEKEAIEELRKKEARWLAAYLCELKNEYKLPWSQVSILFRAMTYTDLYEEALDGQKIPWVRSGGGSFFQSVEVQSLMGLLKWMLSPKDTFSLWIWLSAPWHKLSIKERLRRVKEMDEVAKFGQPDAQSLLEWYQEWELPESPYIRRFLTLVREFENRYPDSEWKDFLTYLQYLQSNRIKASSAEADESVDAVRILSIHQAKGLEFEAVFIPDLSYRSRIEYDDLLIDRDLGIGLKADAVYEKIKEREKEEALEESKRLLYVAMTRAKTHLILSHSSGKPVKNSWASWIEMYKPELKPYMDEKVFI